MKLSEFYPEDWQAFSGTEEAEGKPPLLATLNRGNMSRDVVVDINGIHVYENDEDFQVIGSFESEMPYDEAKGIVEWWTEECLFSIVLEEV